MKYLLFLILFCISPPTFGCLWDTETLEQERQRFPTVLEVLSGVFLQHSPEFYEWRIRNRKELLAKNPENLGYYDDLAVSYSKLGRDKEAIEVMFQKEKIKSGLYETYANLGTFYLHDGDLETGLKYIRKAIEINPNAHFGREKYQAYLAEYLIEKKKQNGKLQFPLDTTLVFVGIEFMEAIDEEFPDDYEPVPEILPDEYTRGFGNFLAKKFSWEDMHQKGLDKEIKYEVALAIKGIVGMMRFGNANSPVLAEVLGDLLIFTYPNSSMVNKNPARNLGTRAYLNASYNVKNEEAKKIYHELINYLFHPVSGAISSYQEISAKMKVEKEAGKKLQKEIFENERKWIAEGLNPEEMFRKTYPTAPVLKGNTYIFPKPEKALPAVKTKPKQDAVHSKAQETSSPENSKNTQKQESDSMVMQLLEIIGSLILITGIIFIYWKRKHDSE